MFKLLHNPDGYTRAAPKSYKALYTRAGVTLTDRGRTLRYCKYYQEWGASPKHTYTVVHKAEHKCGGPSRGSCGEFLFCTSKVTGSAVAHLW